MAYTEEKVMRVLQAARNVSAQEAMEQQEQYNEKARTPFVSQQLIAKARLFEERHAVYGDNYHRFGPIMALLIGQQKLDPLNAQQMSRLGIFVQIVSKITRYAENFDSGGHADSLDDIAVYAMMLQELDHATPAT